MARAFVLVIGSLFALGACTQRSICPAFQSAYIYDKDVLRKKFSYFQEDSTPKVLTASKNQYLVANATPYRKKLKELRTVSMKPVPVAVPDSLSGDSVSMADLDRAARSVIDSTFIEDRPQEASPSPEGDSVYVISKDRELRLLKYNGADSLVYDPVAEKYVPQKPEYYVKDIGLNIEQDNYMWYLRDYLVLPDVRLARLHQQSENNRDSGEKKTRKKERKGFKGFFKNLFKKKDKEADSTAVPEPPKEEFDFIDADTLTQADPPRQELESDRESLASRKKKAREPGRRDVAIVPPTSNKKLKTAQARKEEETLEGGF